MNIKKLKEDMDYNNFFSRLIVSILFFTTYIFLAYLDKNYLIIFGLIIYIIIFYEIYKFFEKKKYIIYVYTIISFLFFYFYTSFYFNFLNFNFFILIIILFDTSSYLLGAKFGKLKIFSKLSPNKTLEGYIYGITITNILSIFFVIYFYKLFLFEKIIFINLIILTALIGDLLQSYFKRINTLKDSSNYLPGHGGFFDRFDSFTFSIIFLTIYNLISI